MYKDAREELKRLEEALLEEEEQQQEEAEETEDVESLMEQLREFLDEEDSEDEIEIPRVYNTDRTDTDLDHFSEEVHSGRKNSLTGLLITAVVLALGIVAVMLWWIIRYGGSLI